MGTRLFLVDSSPAVQRLVEQAVAPENIEVCAFRRAHSALEAAKRQKVDLVVVDYHLEDMAFAAFCERLAAQETLSNTPIIALLGSSDRLEDRQVQTMGVKAILKKPLQADDLIEMVRLLQRGQAGIALPYAVPAGTPAAPEPHAPDSERNGGNGNSDPVRLSELATTLPVEESVSTEPTKVEDVMSEALRGIFAHLFQSLVEQAERSVAIRLPELVAKEVLASGGQIQSTVDRALPGIVGERVTAMEPIVQQTVKTITTTLVKELVDTQLRDMIVTSLPASLAVALKEHMGRIEELVKGMAQDVAVRQARETAETIVREVSRDLVKGVFEQAMKEMAAGLTPAR